MNLHVLDPQSDHELRSLDAASGLSTDVTRRNTTLESILASDRVSDSGLDTSAISARAPRPRLPATRWATIGIAVAAVTGVAVILPTLTAAPSYASWTATPGELARADADVAAAACHDRTGELADDDWLAGARLSTRLVERRGDHVAVLLTGSGGGQTPEASVSCVVHLPVGDTTAGSVAWAASGGGGFAPPAAGEFFEGAMSTLSTGGLFSRGEPVSFVDGRVGNGITGITIHAHGQAVEASIANGTYAAWWPGKRFSEEDPGASGEGGPTPALTYDVTYADGRVARDVDPAAPSTGGEGQREVGQPD